MKKIVGLLILALAVVSCTQEKTAYVDTVMLRDNYSAIQESGKRFEQQNTQLQSMWQAEVSDLQEQIQSFQEEAESLSQKEREERRNALLKKQQQFQQKKRFQQSLLMKQMQSAQDSLTKIIKSTISDYAEKHDYTYVFGANETENILYAKESQNITEEVLKALDGDAASSSEKTNTQSDQAAKAPADTVSK